MPEQDVSDGRIKTEIQDIPNCLSSVIALRPRSFKYVGNDIFVDYGFIAQEFFSVFPQFTFTNGVPAEGPIPPGGIPWSIFKEGILPFLPGAIKELNTTVTSLAAISASSAVSAEQDLGTLTWTGTAPGGTITKKYRWIRIGKRVTVDWQINATTPGLLVSSVSTPLPSDCPAPSLLSNVPVNSWARIGSGSILATANATALGGNSGLFRASDGSFQLRVTTTAGLAATTAIGSVEYFTM